MQQQNGGQRGFWATLWAKTGFGKKEPGVTGLINDAFERYARWGPEARRLLILEIAKCWGSSEWRGFFEKAVKDDDMLVRAYAIDWFFWFGERSDSFLLQSILINDKEPLMKFKAAITLVKLGEYDNMNFEEVQNGIRGDFGAFALGMVREVGKRNPYARGMLGAFAEKTQASDPFVRKCITSMLKTFKGWDERGVTEIELERSNLDIYLEIERSVSRQPGTETRP